MADNDKKFLDEDGVSQFAEETKKYIDNKVSQLDDVYIRNDDTTVVRLRNQNEINLQEDHNNAWFGYRDGKVNNWKFGDGTEGGLADVYVKDLYLGDEKLSETYIRVDDTTIVKLVNDNEINLQEDHHNAWFGYRGGKVTNWKFGDGTEGGLADVYVKDLYLGDEKLSDLLGEKANDDDVVHKTGDETIAGNKTFTDTTTGTLFSGNFECNNKTSYYGTDYFYALSINDGKTHVTNISNDAENRLILSVLSDNEKAGNVFTVGIPRDAATASDTSGCYIQWVGKLRNSVIPQRDNAFSLGLPDFRWEILYVNKINGKDIAYASDIPDVSGLAVDSNVVHKTGDETVAGVKTFTSSMAIDGSDNQYQSYASDYVKGRTPSAIMYQGLRFYDDKKISTVSNHITGAFEIQYNTDGYNKAYVGCRNYAGTTQHNYNVGLRVPNDSTRSIDFYPSADNKINLGASDYKWSDVNTYLINGKTPAYADDLSPYALDAAVVHTKGAEEIGGTKTFTGTVVHKDSTQKIKMENTAVDYDVPVTSTKAASVEFYDKNNKNMARLILQRDTNGRNSFGITTYNRNDSGSELSRKVALYLENDNTCYFSPNVNNLVDLGHSSYHWKNVYTNLVNGETVVTPTYLETKAEEWEFTLSDGSTVTKKIVMA